MSSREIVLTALLPGATAWSRSRRWAVCLLAAGVVVPALIVVVVLATGGNWLVISLDRGLLGWLVVAGAAAVIARIVALAERWNAVGRPRSLERTPSMVAVIVALALFGAMVAVVQVGRARTSLGSTFVETDAALYDAAEQSDDEQAANVITRGTAAAPVSVPRDGSVTTVLGVEDPGETDSTEPPTVAAPSTTEPAAPPPLPNRPDSGVAAFELADVRTVLLLGGDAGPDRFGLRTDTMMLFSLHEPSGRAALISIPRDMEGILFPPDSALGGRYPYGFNRIANAVYPITSADADLRRAYAAGDVRPGVVAIAQAIGYSFDVTIDDYVLIDMQGFLDLVDALGGVTIDLDRSIPMPGNVPGAPTQYPDSIGPGVVAMDGSTALGYVRSRKGDNDYRRAERQRHLLAALAQQVSLTDVVFSFPSIAAALGGTLRTSLTPTELTDVVNVIGGETAVVESLGLVPPLANVARPDFDQLAKVVGDVRLALVTGVPSGWSTG